MTNENVKPDPAGIFAMAKSLDKYGESRSALENVNLSDAYDGGDEFMRQCMRVATMFERWCCTHLDWDRWDMVWPYEMQEKFGPAVYDYQGSVTSLMEFKIPDCRKLAVAMNLPLLPQGEPVTITTEIYREAGHDVPF